VTEDLKERIRQKLEKSSPRSLEESHSAEAAVLMTIFQRDGEPCFLLTQRTEEVATHKGQISFPGGLHEDGDSSLRETGLREMEEEVGIPADFVEVLGPFDQYMAVTNYRVTPFVAFLRDGFSVSLNSREVERILEVPLRFFHQTEPTEEIHHRFGRAVTLYFYNYKGDVIWGLTAAMIKDLVEFLSDDL
jgi:8-oxo-dGTP pyrophosphatase MutT (NUDIX family)